MYGVLRSLALYLTPSESTHPISSYLRNPWGGSFLTVLGSWICYEGSYYKPRFTAHCDVGLPQMPLLSRYQPEEHPCLPQHQQGFFHLDFLLCNVTAVQEVRGKAAALRTFYAASTASVR